jgi:hypothetical protein
LPKESLMSIELGPLQEVKIANAGLYALEGKHAEAAMSLVSAIPGVGDAIGGAGKAAMWAGKLGKGTGN